MAGKVIRLTPEEYMERLSSSDILRDGEEAVQMVDHDCMYFITDHARVISCVSEVVRELKPNPRGGKAKAEELSTDDNNVKDFVKISINGEFKGFYVHDLVAHYFPDRVMSYFTGKGDKLTHHVNGYDKDNPCESNKPECLESLDDKSLHIFMHKIKAEPISTKKALKQLQKFSKMTKNDGNSTVMECPNNEGKGGKIYELTEPITLDLPCIADPEAFIEWYCENFLEEGQQLVQLTWYLGEPDEDIDAVIEEIEFMEKYEKNLKAWRESQKEGSGAIEE